MRIARPGRRRLPPLAGQAEPEVSVPPPLPPEPPEPTVGPSTPSGVSSAAEPPRPHPAANAWPDNAITVTYGELRRLVALHLTLCASTMPHDRPWVWMKQRAQAVADGEAPLLLSEVLSPDDLPPG